MKKNKLNSQQPSKKLGKKATTFPKGIVQLSSADTLLKCNQKNCAFNIKGGCKCCSECKAPPNKVNESCMTCWNCENKDGAVRWAMDTGEAEAAGIVDEPEIKPEIKQEYEMPDEIELEKLEQPKYEMRYVG